MNKSVNELYGVCLLSALWLILSSLQRPTEKDSPLRTAEVSRYDPRPLKMMTWNQTG